MQRDDLFIDPRGGNAPRMRDLGLRFVDALIDALSTAGSRRPLEIPPPRPFPDAATLPRDAVGVDRLLEDFRELIVPGAMNAAHPGYVGHMDTLAAAVPIFAELLAAGLNNNPLFFEQSPTLTRLEIELTRGFAALFGLGDASGGSLTTAGTVANLTAMCAAARRARPDLAEQGFEAGPPPAAFVSELAHLSFEKAATLMGLGRRRLYRVATDERRRLDPAALERAIADARARGEKPFFVGATAGTTVAGDIDPLPEIAEIAAREGLWFHVDAAYGGTLALSENARGKLRGVERADSVTFNPQKWMYVPKACAMILFRDLQEARTLLRTPAPYAPARSDLDVNLGDHAVQGTRHADALKLWMGVRAVGLKRFGEMVDAQLAQARRLARRIAADPALELINDPPETNIVVFGVRGGRDHAGRGNVRAQEAVAARGRAWISCPQFRGTRVLRALMLNPYTDDAVLDALLEDVRAAAPGVGV
ncbi:MAG TPA: aminotransferase class I/II-fold pyridoxal phosphate-dependent enzyme [Planctomycetota bacterium]|nr:aminotransferase class I/II-fold pyridoxal phosphate-dependent enzyme [Planctomycetota bacterium]